MLRRHAAIAIVLLLLTPSPLRAAPCEGLRDGARGVVTEVRDGDTVLLDNGMVVRLVGMQAPKLPLGRPDFEAWPKADEALQVLTEIALNKPVLLRHSGVEVDRHGRQLAQMFVLGDDELWVQGEMVSRGMARVYAFPDNRACLATLLQHEGRARLMRLGIWSDPYYHVRRADRPQALLERVGHYELVEGRVLLAEAAGGGVYLNFGRFWKEDLTVVIETRALRLFEELGLDPLLLGGALVRVRGWVDDRDGPRIEVTHPEQIEVLATQ